MPRLFSIASIVFSLSTIGAAWTSHTTASPATTGTGIVTGRVIDAATGAPVADVLMGLSQRTASGSGTPAPPATSAPLVQLLTDDQGHFVFRDVPKGSYLLLATAPGYIVSTYGQGRPAGPARTIDLADGDRVGDLTIRLWRHSVISGTVVDETGEPVVGITVRALRRANNGAGGALRYMPGAQTTTDDRGQYRITGLQPGQFLVAIPQTEVTVPSSVVDAYIQSAAGRGGARAGGRVLDLMNSQGAVPSAGGGVRVDTLLLQSSAGGRLMTIPPLAANGSLLVYPPSVYTSAGASSTALTLKPGDERNGIDFQLSPLPAVRVSGVVTADGAPVPNAVVRLVRSGAEPLQNEADFESAATVSNGDGTFTMLGVPSGQYVLKVLRTPKIALAPGLAANPAIATAYATPPPANATASSPVIGAQVPLVVGGVDIANLAVPLRAGATVSGRVVFDGDAPATTQQLQTIGILITSEDGGTPGTGIQISRVSVAGTFTIVAPSPGRYLITPVGMPAWKPAGIFIAGRPLTSALDLSSDDVNDVSVSYTTKVGQIAGTARASDGRAHPTAEIVVFSTDRTLWVQDPLNPRQPHIDQASKAGAFVISGLLPGDYFIAAVDDADVPELADVPFVDALSKFATRVTVNAGETLTHDVSIGRIPR